LCLSDTYVIVVTASDADDNTTDNAKIAYQIIQQEPVGEMMFNIHRSSGEIKVRMNTLDREKQETYKLIIIGTDMDGFKSESKNRPLTGTGTLTINIRDVNDNVPELEESSYNCTVKETIRNVEAIRLKATDKDKPYTENWEAVYTIISGNENGYFNITTDPKTNEGILMVTKELDYETMKKIDLEVVVNNTAPYHKSVVLGKRKTYSINIKVLNELEAPFFQHPVKVISITENRTTIDLKKVIVTYTATDSDTLLTATNVRYLKGEDVNNLVNINEQTAEVRLNKYPEHKFLKNGEYTAKIVCITNDVTPKTSTGTLVIQVQDFKNHCPIQISPHGKMCYGDSVVYVTAKDEGKYTNANTFKYKMASKYTKENWSCEKHNTTTVILRSQEILWPGYYTVGIVVQNQEEKSCEVQKLQITVCTCTEAKVCQYERQSGTSAVLGIGGVLVFLLVILLLFAILMILLLCECRRGFRKFQAFPFEEEQRHIVYHIEGRGEDQVVLFLFLFPQELVLISQLPVNVAAGSSGQFIDACEDWRKYGWESQEEYINNHLLINQYEGDFVDKNATTLSGGAFEHVGTIAGMALPQTFFHNYYEKKTLELMIQEGSTDELLVSNYETCGSVTSSTDCLGCLYEEHNLDFLDDLGPQYKVLAEICCGSVIKPEVRCTHTPQKTISSSSQVGVKVESNGGGVQSEVTSVSASSSTTTTEITSTNYGGNINSGGATTTATAGQTLLVQQPNVYLSSTPMYIMEQQHQPTLYLASGPIMGER
ncbi:desmoglein-2, partial [Silurus asotus]